ncbi:hypothetical protein Cflav_PD2500 [Pedosphaera parvula Ellin514]|uniref:Uncharacterized protein n=2 Tax=Pedosphaera TaxID=1032526 RepID=B9XKV0_PEDPL|nr:hypothetical protein Cflav_PD2500 [Pedosphaera parvula Ellin514]
MGPMVSICRFSLVGMAPQHLQIEQAIHCWRQRIVLKGKTFFASKLVKQSQALEIQLAKDLIYPFVQVSKAAFYGFCQCARKFVSDFFGWFGVIIMGVANRKPSRA